MIDLNDLQLQFVLDEKGNRTGVIIPLHQFHELMQELGFVTASDALESEKADADTPVPSTIVPVWEKIRQLGASVSDDQWEKVPPDLAANLDAYLYDTPKEKQS